VNAVSEEKSFSIQKFIRGLTYYTLGIGIVSYGIRHFADQIPISTSYLFILIFLYMVTLAILWVLNNNLKNKLSRFANAFMLLNFGKIMLFALIMFGYAYFNREDAVSFIITFFVYYLLYTFYEVFVLLRMNRSTEENK
jgi:hypothetical protein